MTILKQRNVTSPGVNHVLIAGSFIPNGSGAIATQYGRGFSVTRTSTGLYKVTLSQSFANFVSIVVTGQFASNITATHVFTVGGISIANKTFEILHLEAADTGADEPKVADISTSTTVNKINFMCVVALSDIPGAGV